MKKTLITSLVSIVLTAIIFFTIIHILDQNEQQEADAIEVVNSQILKEDRELLIHFPPDYDPAKTYPALYVLDGSSQDIRMAYIANVLERAGAMPDVITIGIPNTNRNRDLTPHYGRRDQDEDIYGDGDQFLEFLVQEAVPFIEERYPVNDHRMLAGHSRAGLFSFYAFLEQPESFDSYFCFSPAFWRDDKLIVEKTTTFLRENNSYSSFIYLSLGTEENNKMKDGYDAVTSLLDEKAPDGLKIFHNYINKANHGSNLVYSTPEALKYWADYYKEKSN